MAPGSPSSRASNSGGSTSRDHSKQGSSKQILRILRWVVISVICVCVYANVRPYEIAVHRFFGNQLSSSLLRTLAHIPILNGLVAILASSVSWIIGFLFWALLQSVELFPIILQRDKSFMRTLIHASEGHQTFEIKDGEDPALSMLKRWYNLFPSVTIVRARNAALFCYVIDFLVVSAVYPPARNFGQAVFLHYVWAVVKTELGQHFLPTDHVICC